MPSLFSPSIWWSHNKNLRYWIVIIHGFFYHQAIWRSLFGWPWCFHHRSCFTIRHDRMAKRCAKPVCQLSRTGGVVCECFKILLFYVSSVKKESWSKVWNPHRNQYAINMFSGNCEVNVDSTTSSESRHFQIDLQLLNGTTTAFTFHQFCTKMFPTA